ncbi:hypothetical protein K1719_008432 [Acacia pycnantha]|nr:hypothetical protein K1719_008432 [Acacia pycnantha]
MPIKGGSNKACAACKYQRRRCSKECALAPYFPSDQPKKFINAHRLFGVANIKKILDQVEPSLRDECMTSIVFESNMREQFRVMGCLGMICDYNKRVLAATEELNHIHLKLSVYRNQYPYPISHEISSSMSMEFSTDPFSMSNHIQYDNSEVGRSINHLQYDNNGIIRFDGGNGGNNSEVVRSTNHLQYDNNGVLIRFDGGNGGNNSEVVRSTNHLQYDNNGVLIRFDGGHGGNNSEVVRSTNHLQYDNNGVIRFDGGNGGNEGFSFQPSINPAQSSHFTVNHQPEMVDTVEYDNLNLYNEMPSLMECKEQPN